MFGSRIEYHFSLKVKTPLHCGTGNGKTLDVSKKPDTDRKPDYADVVRGANGLPYIPAPTIKGVFRALAGSSETLTADRLSRLFGGEIADSEKAAPKVEAHMGRLMFRGAEAKEYPSYPEAPYAQYLEDKASYIGARTSVDPRSGVASDHKLFFQEEVFPGTLFDLRVTLLDEDGAECVADWEALLAKAAGLGLQIGKGRADGQGRLVFEGPIKVTAKGIGKDGTLESISSRTIEAQELDRSNDEMVFQLYCEGPFLVADSSTVADRRKRQSSEDDHKDAQIKAQKLNQDSPILPGSSVSGVLRQRARYLWRRHLLKGVEPNSAEKPFGDSDPAPVLELFGDRDSQARLHIVECELAGAKPFDITSVKIDRFTGGPVDNALFRTSAFISGTLMLRLRLVRRADQELSAEAEELRKMLADDVRKRGLRLGAGTNKGFGWFKPQPEGR